MNYSRVHSALCPARRPQSGEQRLGAHAGKASPLCSWERKEEAAEKRRDPEEMERVSAPGEHACRGALRPLLLTLSSAVSDSV